MAHSGSKSGSKRTISWGLDKLAMPAAIETEGSFALPLSRSIPALLVGEGLSVARKLSGRLPRPQELNERVAHRVVFGISSVLD